MSLKLPRQIYRLVLVTLLLIVGILLLLTIKGRDPSNRTVRDWRIINSCMGVLCWILGLKIHVTGNISRGTQLLVANHISWHDIVVVQSLLATGFIGKYEIKNWPLVGWLAYQGNTLFVRRGKHGSFKKIHAAMTKRLKTKQNIMLFPEGTTTTGESVKSFRSRLLEPAIQLSIPIQPVAIWYQGKNHSCSELSFTGDENLISHLFRTMGEPQIDVYLHFCQPIMTDKDDDRREIGRRAHALVAEELGNIIQSVRPD